MLQQNHQNQQPSVIHVQLPSTPSTTMLPPAPTHPDRPSYHHHYHPLPPYALYGLPLDYGLFSPIHDYVFEQALFSPAFRSANVSITGKLIKSKPRFRKGKVIQVAPSSGNIPRFRKRKKVILGASNSGKEPAKTRQIVTLKGNKISLATMKPQKKTFKNGRKKKRTFVPKIPSKRNTSGGRKKILSFNRTFQVPGKKSKIEVSSKDIRKGLRFRFNNKYYTLTLKQILNILRRKQLRSFNNIKKKKTLNVKKKNRYYYTKNRRPKKPIKLSMSSSRRKT